jgi:hypothetical protein
LFSFDFRRHAIDFHWLERMPFVFADIIEAFASQDIFAISFSSLSPAFSLPPRHAAIIADFMISADYLMPLFTLRCHSLPPHFRRCYDIRLPQKKKKKKKKKKNDETRANASRGVCRRDAAQSAAAAADALPLPARRPPCQAERAAMPLI